LGSKPVFLCVFIETHYLPIPVASPVRPQSAFTLVEIMIVVAIIGLLAAVAIPNFLKSRTTAQKNTCIANLRSIDGAVQRWAVENKMDSSTPVTFSDILDYLKGSQKPVCPMSGTYTLTIVGAVPVCSQSALGHSLAN